MGIIRLITPVVRTKALTSPRDKALDSKRSSVLSCRERSIVVLTTFLAFVEVHKVRTITRPAMNKKMVGVATLAANPPMENSSGSMPEANHD